ncbi:conserved hypothetical protein [Leishmania braziliensis MHOM/BR/75/M2904]|uniref:Uncharacterized protein n=3 Tax=Viannia TaxID=37616 RepID=A4H5W9_LEIBR|nr:conserved hypothetical protein [Leishmania braziliensis MHOM/BR/75/M2904]KAI5690776.1 hypothetical protein MNV84_01209 [Leishmania braziliensis]CAJ2467624.1 unnamed protein product [Leishmania braziliensis]CAJ2468185.1 unnamed protein product [Leishmania braziliensis]CAM41886.2 conserved hypothetical protein [Leishmania braziliensis MHOM/BR/75/M2904]SYZ63363.1 hypothetical_protein [Leishmania braziliensis MHOM/BR/75/M2904]
MPVDYSKKLDALRELYERVQQKDANIAEEAYAAAGVKNKARLKDIEKEISATKKKVSHEVKKVTDEEIEREYEAMAKEHKMTIEEFKETVLGKERQPGVGSEFSERHTALRRERAEQRDLKEMRRQVERGDFDMAVDYV